MTAGASGPLSCRSCGHTDLNTILSLGHTPLANALLRADQTDEPEKTYPLDLAFCPHCCLVQITETVPPELLFSDYPYLSSFSETMLRHAEELVTRLIRDRGLCGPESRVVEIASNDGYLLQYYKRANIEVLGVEPAANVAAVAERNQISTIKEFFTEELAKQLPRADVVHAHNVLAHVPDLNGFVRGLKTVMKDDGIAIIEVPYVKEMLDCCEFDTIYHEHLSYFSLTALSNLFTRNKLNINSVERLPIHGGTLRIYVSHNDNPDPSVQSVLQDETDWGVRDLSFYTDFSDKVEGLRKELVGLLQKLKNQNRRIAVYGASAKGSTLLNYCHIGSETLDYVVDRSTVKQGLYTPGMHLQIHAPEKLLADMPDYVLLLTWNFADEILEQQSEYRRRGGRFIIPIPSVKVI
ncbi:MAG TPA: class I SAM-dependent methyltransferase [Pyrinomonadaceae bacterium]|nr:class I SAM-dependent methyltransferase [Pyrinomonadaceae bacterium]